MAAAGPACSRAGDGHGLAAGAQRSPAVTAEAHDAESLGVRADRVGEALPSADLLEKGPSLGQLAGGVAALEGLGRHLGGVDGQAVEVHALVAVVEQVEQVIAVGHT